MSAYFAEKMITKYVTKKSGLSQLLHDDLHWPTSTLKDAAVDCSTKWDESEFQSPTVQTAKEWRNACVKEQTAQNLN